MRRKLLMIALLVLLTPTAVWGDGEKVITKAECDQKEDSAYSSILDVCIPCGMTSVGEGADPLSGTPAVDWDTAHSGSFGCPNPLDPKSTYTKKTQKAALRYCSALVQAKLVACQKAKQKFDIKLANAIHTVQVLRDDERGKFCEKFGVSTDITQDGKTRTICSDEWDAIKNISATKEMWEDVRDGECDHLKISPESTNPCPEQFQRISKDIFPKLKNIESAIRSSLLPEDENTDPLAFIAGPEHLPNTSVEKYLNKEFPLSCVKICEPGPTSDVEAARYEVKEFETVITYLERRGVQIGNAQMTMTSQVGDVQNWLKMTDKTEEGKLRIIKNPETPNKFNLLDKIIRLISQILGTFGVIMLLVGAIYMIVSQGDENQLQKGKQILIYTALGLLLGFLSYTIVQLVLDFIIR